VALSPVGTERFLTTVTSFPFAPDPLTNHERGGYRGTVEMNAEKVANKQATSAAQASVPSENLRRSTTPPNGVAFVHATPSNFIARVPRTSRDASPPPAHRSQLENPVPTGWAKSKELAALAAASMIPGASLSAMIGGRLANGLRRPSTGPSITPQDASLEVAPGGR
jgi:hypothetical protein